MHRNGSRNIHAKLLTLTHSWEEEFEVEGYFQGFFPSIFKLFIWKLFQAWKGCMSKGISKNTAYPDSPAINISSVCFIILSLIYRWPSIFMGSTSSINLRPKIQ